METRRMRSPVGRILAGACFFLILTAQQPGRELDPRALERPQPLCAMAAAAPRAAMQNLVKILQKAKFEISQARWNDGEIRARRPDGESEDRVVIWLERDFSRPNEELQVFLLYGRYDKFFGETQLQRVVVDEGFEQSRIGKLKSDIIAAGQ